MLERPPAPTDMGVLDNLDPDFVARANGVECVPFLNAALDNACHNEPNIRTEPFSNENGGILILDLLKRFYQLANLHPRPLRRTAAPNYGCDRKQTNGSYQPNQRVDQHGRIIGPLSGSVPVEASARTDRVY